MKKNLFSTAISLFMMIVFAISAYPQWSPVCSAMPAGTCVWSMAATGSDIFTGTSAGVWWSPINPSGNYFTITSDAPAGGTIVPAGDVTVNEGCSRTFTIVPASGFRISDVVVDGASNNRSIERVKMLAASRHIRALSSPSKL